MTGRESNKIQLAVQDLVDLLFERIGGLNAQEADQIKEEFQTILVGPDLKVGRCQRLLECVKACDCSPDAPIQILDYQHLVSGSVLTKAVVTMSHL